MVYWLVFFAQLSMPIGPMHVGNFQSLGSCQEAAKAATVVNPKGLNYAPIYMCIQANEKGTSPPADKAQDPNSETAPRANDAKQTH